MQPSGPGGGGGVEDVVGWNLAGGIVKRVWEFDALGGEEGSAFHLAFQLFLE